MSTMTSFTCPYGTMSGDYITALGDYLEYFAEFGLNYAVSDVYEDLTLFGVEGGVVARSYMTISLLC